jgi:hypothetical protein
VSLPSPTIHRKQFGIIAEQTIRLPRGAALLHIAAGYIGANLANPVIELWYHCDLDQPLVARRFRIVGTGHLADVDPSQYFGTVIHDLDRGRGVWHVFDLGEITEPPERP